MSKAPPDRDIGLGTAYERLAIYRRLARWFEGGVATAAEGPVDGFAGIGGLHLLPLARRGCRVTVCASDARALDAVAAAYRHAGALDRLTLFQGERLPDERFDLVLDFNGLPHVENWRAHLGMLAARARELVVFVTYPFSYGAFVSRALSLLERGPRAPRQYQHETTLASRLVPELERLGRIRERAWVDCPWWPDLFVQPGATLAQELRDRLHLRLPAPSPRFVYPADSFPYGGDPPSELVRALGRHPAFDDSVVAPVFAHHRAYRVLVD